MMTVLGPFPAHLWDRIPPLNATAQNGYISFAEELTQMRTRRARQHRLGLWNCPRCDPGSATWFSVARALGQCAKKCGDAAVKQTTANDCGHVDVSTSISVNVFVVL